MTNATLFFLRNLKKLAQIFPKKYNDKFTVKELDTLNVNQVESVLKDANLVANYSPFDLYAEEVIRFARLTVFTTLISPANFTL